MKALTIWQPWASLILLGAKPYEFRGWSAHKSAIGQRIAIHAGQRPVRKSEIKTLIDRLNSDEAWDTGLIKKIALPFLQQIRDGKTIVPMSAIICTAILGTPVRADEIINEFGGPINDSNRSEHANFAWPLTSIEICMPPVPMPGMQGLWNLNEKELT